MSGYYVEVERFDADVDGTADVTAIGPFRAKGAAQAVADRLDRRFRKRADEINKMTYGNTTLRFTVRPFRTRAAAIAETWEFLDDHDDGEAAS